MVIILDDLPVRQSLNAAHELGTRPLCPCCGGGKVRKGYRHTKATSHKMNARDHRAKPRERDRQRGRGYWSVDRRGERHHRMETLTPPRQYLVTDWVAKSL